MNARIEIVKTSFSFIVASWKEVEWNKSTQNYSLGAFLEQNLDLSDFGSKIEHIRFVNIMVPPDLEIMHPNEIIYHRSRNELGLYWRMDYSRVMNSTLAEFRIYLADFFLEVLTIAKNTKPIRGFDYDGFIAAVKAVLPEWLASELEV